MADKEDTLSPNNPSPMNQIVSFEPQMSLENRVALPEGGGQLDLRNIL